MGWTLLRGSSNKETEREAQNKYLMILFGEKNIYPCDSAIERFSWESQNDRVVKINDVFFFYRAVNIIKPKQIFLPTSNQIDFYF